MTTNTETLSQRCNHNSKSTFCYQSMSEQFRDSCFSTSCTQQDLVRFHRMNDKRHKNHNTRASVISSQWTGRCILPCSRHRLITAHPRRLPAVHSRSSLHFTRRLYINKQHILKTYAYYQCTILTPSGYIDTRSMTWTSHYDCTSLSTSRQPCREERLAAGRHVISQCLPRRGRSASRSGWYVNSSHDAWFPRCCCYCCCSWIGLMLCYFRSWRRNVLNWHKLTLTLIVTVLFYERDFVFRSRLQFNRLQLLPVCIRKWRLRNLCSQANAMQ